MAFDAKREESSANRAGDVLAKPEADLNETIGSQRSVEYVMSVTSTNRGDWLGINVEQQRCPPHFP